MADLSAGKPVNLDISRHFAARPLRFRTPKRWEVGRILPFQPQFRLDLPRRFSAVEGLFGQCEEDRRLAPVRRAFGAAGGRGQQRHPDAVHVQVDHLGHSSRSQFRPEPAGEELDP